MISAPLSVYFDTGKNPSEEEPERFYHGFAFCGKSTDWKIIAYR